MQNDNSGANVIQAAQQITLAIANLNKTINAVFPQGNTIASTAGAASGKYLNVIGTDGNPYKIQLLLP